MYKGNVNDPVAINTVYIGGNIKLWKRVILFVDDPAYTECVIVSRPAHILDTFPSIL